jgi:hypothetical protein
MDYGYADKHFKDLIFFALAEEIAQKGRHFETGIRLD